MTNLKTISVADFEQVCRGPSAPVMIDVRSTEEYAACHLEGAELYPLNCFDPATVLEATATGTDTPLYILCKAGGRAKKAAQQLAPYTRHPVYVVEGGTDACVAAGLPYRTK